MQRAFLVAYAAAVIAVPRPIADRPSLGLYVPTDLRCDGAKLPSVFLRDALYPDDERQHLCGTVATSRATFAWSRHSLFVRNESAWTFVARTSLRIVRGIRLPSGDLAFLADGALVGPKSGSAELAPIDDVLDAYDAARMLAAADGRAQPPSPLQCLGGAYVGSLSIGLPSALFHEHPARRHNVTLEVGGDRGTIASTESENVREVFAADLRREYARIAKALATDREGAETSRIWLAWNCDGVVRSAELTGGRAESIVAIARSVW